jgi:spermidine/putrescine transport system substrate-binding protein
MYLHHSWSGDLLAGAFYYMPSGVSPDVLSYWWPETGGVVQNDFLAVTRAAESPVLAHMFLNFLLEETVAYENFTQFNGYVPPQNGIDAESLVSEGLIPESLAPAVVRPDQFLANQELLQLTVEGERLWDQAWSAFRAG